MVVKAHQDSADGKRVPPVFNSELFSPLCSIHHARMLTEKRTCLVMREKIKRSKRSKWKENTTHIFHWSKCSPEHNTWTVTGRQTDGTWWGGRGWELLEKWGGSQSCTEMSVVLWGQRWGLNTSRVSVYCQGLNSRIRTSVLGRGLCSQINNLTLYFYPFWEAWHSYSVEMQKMSQNSSKNISPFILLCSFPLCCHLLHLDDVCIKPAEVSRGLWSSLTTSQSIFRLESRLCHISNCLTETRRYRHTGASVLLTQTGTSDVVFHHTDMLQHVHAHMGWTKGKRNNNKDAWVQLSNFVWQ